jgi:triacylglycerol lipase
MSEYLPPAFPEPCINLSFLDAAPKEACVLAHGLLGFDSVSVATIEFSYWRGIKEALEAIGCEVLIARVRHT